MNNRIRKAPKETKLRIAKQIAEPVLFSLIPGKAAINSNTQKNNNISKTRASPINDIEAIAKRTTKISNLK